MGSTNVNDGVSRLLGQISLALTTGPSRSWTGRYAVTMNPARGLARALTHGVRNQEQGNGSDRDPVPQPECGTVLLHHSARG